MGRILNQGTFQISQSIKIECVSEKTSMAFRHLATIYKNGIQVGYGRIPYQNRTWERYEFQSVMERAVDNSSLSTEEKAMVRKWLEGDRTDWSGFKTTSMIAGLGDIFGQNIKEKNAWKTRMLKAGVQGLDIPDDWDTLDEGVKQKRLNAVIGLMGDVGNKKEKLKKQIKKNGGLDVHKETKGWK